MAMAQESKVALSFVVLGDWLGFFFLSPGVLYPSARLFNINRPWYSGGEIGFAGKRNTYGKSHNH